MKTSRISILIIFALCIGFFVARWAAAQSPNQPPTKKPVTANNNLALDQLTLLLANLNETKQTNTLRLFNDYANAMIAQQMHAEMSVKLLVLNSLRAGLTNQVINLLEEEMTADAVGFVASYRELSASQREKLDLKSLQKVHDYCNKFQVKSGDSTIDEFLTNSFKLLDAK
jgi:hypothetical protein